MKVLSTITRTLEVPSDVLFIERSEELFSFYLNNSTFTFRFSHDDLSFPRLVNLSMAQEHHEVVLSKLDYDRASV